MNDDKTVQNKPLFVTEEEPAAPPPPPTPGGAPSVSPPTLPSTPIVPLVPPADRSQPSSPVSPSPSSPPTGGDGSQKKNSDSILPPIIEVPKKKSRAKLVAGLAAVLLLVVSIPLAVFVLGQNTELREKASPADETFSCTPGEYRRTCTERPYGCTYRVYQCNESGDSENDLGTETNCALAPSECNEWAPTSTPTQATPTESTRPACTDQCTGVSSCRDQGGSVDNSMSCSGSTVCCIGGDGTGGSTPTPGDGTGGGAVSQRCAENPGDAPAATDGNNIYSQGCSVVASFVNVWGQEAGRRWMWEHNLELACQSTTLDSTACDGQTLRQQSTNVLQDFYSVTSNKAQACSNWVTQHNSDPGTTCQSAAGANQCTGVRIYKYPYDVNNEVSAPFNGKLAGGDPIKVCLLTSGSGGRPEVAFDGAQNWEFAGETGPRGEACRQHDIPAGATTLRFGARY